MTLTKGIARDHKGQGIVANCLVAGTIATARPGSYLDADEPAGGGRRWTSSPAPSLFLCSPQSSGINGAAVELNAREVD